MMKSGIVYEGGFLNDKTNGHGNIITFSSYTGVCVGADKSKYVGDFKDDNREGKGVLT